MKYPLSIFFISLQFFVFSQNKDSLVSVTQSGIAYTEKYDAYETLSSFYLKRDLDSAKYFIKQFQRLGEVHQDQKFLKKAFEFDALVAEKETHYDKAIKLYHQLEQIYSEEKDTLQLSEIYKKIGKVYNDKNEAGHAVQFYLKSSELKEQISDYKGMASIYNGIGSLYYAQKNYGEALEYYNKGLQIADSIKFHFAIGILNMNIASIYKDIYFVDSTQISIDTSLHSRSEAYQNAISYYEKSLKLFKEISAEGQIPNVYTNLGIIDTVNAISYFKKSYEIRKKTGDIKGQWRDLNNIAKHYVEEKEYRTAFKYSQKAKQLAEDNDLLKFKYKSLWQLSTIYHNRQNYKEAFVYLSDYINLKDSLEEIEDRIAFAELEKTWNYEKREKENAILKQGNELLKKENELDEARIAKQRLYLWASGGGLLLFGFLIFFILRGYRQKQKANQLLSIQKEQIEEANEELNQQNEEIAAQRDEIQSQRDLVTQQKDHIEKIHKEVSESIDYAERLQGAILPKADILMHKLADFSVLFMPKDKVSGDFYWWTEIEGQTIITAADCTGHGVPGAFMSMLGVSNLKEIVTKEYITQPALILKKLRKEIIRTLDQKGVAGEQKDGMDMALLSINTKERRVQFSGANNPLYIISEHDLTEQLGEVKTIDIGGSATLYELKPDKMPIAIYEKMDNFTNKEFTLNEGDAMYMFSDGYADQFGGPKGKKFMYKPFKRLLLSNYEKPMEEQKEILRKAFVDWRGEEEQIDDVVVIGLKL